MAFALISGGRPRWISPAAVVSILLLGGTNRWFINRNGAKRQKLPPPAGRLFL
jgi:hypothetical protein